MISLARLTLVREWRRFLPAVLAVGFAGLVVLMQLVLLLGIFRTVSVYIDRSSADLWVGYPGTKSVDLARNLSARNEVFLRSHPAVITVESYLWSSGDLRRADRSATLATVVGINPRPGALALAHALTAADRRALDEPDTVLVDVSNLANLRTHIGDTLELNGRRVKVVGLTRGLNSIGGANIVTSLSTARAVTPGDPGDSDTVGYFLVKLRDPAAAARVRDELAPLGTNAPYSIWTAADFSKISQLYWLLESGLGLGFVLSGGIGLLVGIVITSQTLKAVVQSSIREYATLRALGVSVRSLRIVVLEQSAWVGVAGITITSLIAATVVHLAASNHVLVAAPWWAFAGTSIFMLTIAITSGALALRVLAQSEPATLLR
jgi:putative ABC transport system permease protein